MVKIGENVILQGLVITENLWYLCKRQRLGALKMTILLFGTNVLNGKIEHLIWKLFKNSCTSVNLVVQFTEVQITLIINRKQSMTKQKTLTVRVTHNQHAKYTKAANDIGMNLSRYVIKLLEDDINSTKVL